MQYQNYNLIFSVANLDLAKMFKIASAWLVFYCALRFRQIDLYFKTTSYFSKIKTTQVLYGKNTFVKVKVAKKQTNKKVLVTENNYSRKVFRYFTIQYWFFVM